MTVFFDPIEKEDVKRFFNEFYDENGVFFEIIHNKSAIGFYGIKNITEKVCEISTYSKKIGGFKITKKLILKCLKFPFSLGFSKVLIRAETEKMKILLCHFKKNGVNYLFEHNNFYLFEVLP